MIQDFLFGIEIWFGALENLGISGYFFPKIFSSRSQVVFKKVSNDTFFVQKEVLGEKIII